MSDPTVSRASAPWKIGTRYVALPLRHATASKDPAMLLVLRAMFDSIGLHRTRTFPVSALFLCVRRAAPPRGETINPSIDVLAGFLRPFAEGEAMPGQLIHPFWDGSHAQAIHELFAEMAAIPREQVVRLSIPVLLELGQHLLHSAGR